MMQEPLEAAPAPAVPFATVSPVPFATVSPVDGAALESVTATPIAPPI